MKSANELPKGYRAFELLNVCSNKLLNGAKILAVGDVFPLLIGSGSKPQIWLKAIASIEKKKFVSLVEASISQHPQVHVEEIGRQVVVRIQGATVLRVEQTSDAQAFVAEMDLRPAGYNVYGNSNQLTAGGMTFSGSTFSGGGIFISFGDFGPSDQQKD